MRTILFDFINQHIHSFTKEDLRKLADQYSFSYQEEELNVVYSFLMNHYQDLLNQKIEVFEEIRNSLNPILYKQLLETYIDLKQKYL